MSYCGLLSGGNWYKFNILWSLALTFCFKKYLSVNCLANDGNVLTLGRLEIGDTVYLFFLIYIEIHIAISYLKYHIKSKKQITKI